MTTCLEKLEMSGNFTDVRDFSKDPKCPGIVTINSPKTFPKIASHAHSAIKWQLIPAMHYGVLKQIVNTDYTQQSRIIPTLGPHQP